MVNYYQYLRLRTFETNPRQIQRAYDEAVRYFLDNQSITDEQRRRELVDVSEAYLVLSDPDLRHRYDEALREGITDDTDLNDAMSERHAQAEEHVASLLADIRKAERPGKRKHLWLALALIAITAFLIMAFFMLCDRPEKAPGANGEAVVETVQPISPESPWSFYSDNRSFSFWAPQTLEQRAAGGSSPDYIVMQQAGLNQKTDSAFRTYARAIFIYSAMPDGRHTYSATEERELDDQTKESLYNLALRESAGNKITGTPVYGHMLIGDTRAIYITYHRQGGEGPVTNTIYQLCNDTESIEIITSYRTADSLRWAPDLKDVIRTFRWSRSR